MLSKDMRTATAKETNPGFRNNGPPFLRRYDFDRRQITTIRSLTGYARLISREKGSMTIRIGNPLTKPLVRKTLENKEL